MRTRRFILALCLLGIGLALVGVFAASKPQLYQGKTVDQWVSLLDSDAKHERQRDEASWALVQIGARALPELARILSLRNNRTEALRNWAVRVGILKPRPVELLELQSRACEAAYHLAERANVDTSRLVPNLQYHFTNGTYADANSGRALAQAGPAGIAVLTNLLFTGTSYVRDQAAWSLHHVKQRPEVIAALTRSATSETDKTLRANAVGYLEGCGGPAEELVPLGLRFLRSEDSYARWQGARLRQHYSLVPEVRAAFEVARSDSDPRVRSIAESALTQSEK